MADIYTEYKKAIASLYSDLESNFLDAHTLYSKNILKHESALTSDIIYSGLNSCFVSEVSKLVGGLNSKAGLFHEDRLRVLQHLQDKGLLYNSNSKIVSDIKKVNYFMSIPIETRELILLVSRRMKLCSNLTYDYHAEQFKLIFDSLRKNINSGGTNLVTVEHDIDGLICTKQGFIGLIELKSGEKNQDHHIWGDYSKALETWAAIVFYLLCYSEHKSLIEMEIPVLNKLYHMTPVSGISWNTISLLYVFNELDSLEQKNSQCDICFNSKLEYYGGLITAVDFYKHFFGIDFMKLVKIEQDFHKSLNKKVWNSLSFLKSELTKLNLF